MATSNGTPATQKPAGMKGMRHVALFVNDLETAEHFYVNLLGMEVEWRPDPDNVYLCSGSDNLALHRASDASFAERQQLDHIGFIIESPDQVDQWYAHLHGAGVKCLNKPKTHRDGARSFYCFDPAGIQVQIIYHPPISDKN